MKIAILSFTSGLVNRGAETVVKELTTRLSKKHQVEVYSSLSLGIREMRKFNIQALKEADKFGADVIMPVNGGEQSLLTRLYCLIKGKKMVIIGMAGLGWCDGWNLLMRPNVFIASTKRNYIWAKKFYGLGVRVETIPHGVDLTKFKMEGKKRQFAVKGPIILCVAGPNEYKRVEATIRAVSRLDKGSLVLVGGSDSWEKLGKRLLKKRFERIQVSHEELPEVYRGADVFTMVSESSEEFGIVNLEALASGLPMVVTDDELRQEILGKYGTYVKDVEGKEYEEKLKQAMKQRKKCPDKWLEKFSWDLIASQFEEILSQL